MKNKILLFLILLSSISFAQVSNGGEQEFDYGIKNNASTEIATPPFLVSQGIDGTYGKMNRNNVIEYLEFASAVNLPVTGEQGKLYLTKDNNRLYRFNGTIYQELTTDISGKEDIANKQNSLAVDGTNTKYPTVTAVNTGLALKANLASPTFTGATTATSFIKSSTPATNILLAGGGDIAQNTAFNKNFGTTAGTVAEGNDSRFTDARIPLPNSTYYIQNQNASAQSANMWISGTGKFGSSVTAQNASGNVFSAKNTVGGFINLGINSNISSTAYINYTNSLDFTGGAVTFDSSVTAPTFVGNLTGNAASATTWGGRTADLTTLNTSMDLMVSRGTDGIFRLSQPTQVSSFLGLGSNAYNSTAFLPLSGGTISGNVNVTGDIIAKEIISKNSGDYTLPVLGVLSGQFKLLNQTGQYGLSSGVMGNGDTWIQSGRFDGGTNAYKLMLQPSGGSISIGDLSGTGDGNIVAATDGTLKRGVALGSNAYTSTAYLPLSGGTVNQLTVRNDLPIRLESSSNPTSYYTLIGTNYDYTKSFLINNKGDEIFSYGQGSEGIKISSPTAEGNIKLATNGITRMAISNSGSTTFSGSVTASPATLSNHVVVKSQLDAAVGNSTSGDFSATATNMVNVADFFINSATYTKIGNIVNAYVSISINPIASAKSTFNLPLPIARQQTSFLAIGSGSGSTYNNIIPIYISSNSTTTALVTLYSPPPTNISINIHFQYDITK